MEGSTDSSPPVPRSELSGGPTQTSSQRPVPSMYVAPENHDALIASVLEDLHRRRRVPRLLAYAAALHALATPVGIVLLFVFVLAPSVFFWRSNPTWLGVVRDSLDYSQLIVVIQILFAVIAATLAIIYRREQPRWMAVWTISFGGLTTVVSFLLAIGHFPPRDMIGLVGACGGFLSLVAGLEASQIGAHSTIQRDAFSVTPTEREVPPPPSSPP